MRLISEYTIANTINSLHTTQHFDSIEDAVNYVESRPDNMKHGIERYFGEYTVHGKCDLLMTVETEYWNKNYYLFEE